VAYSYSAAVNTAISYIWLNSSITFIACGLIVTSKGRFYSPISIKNVNSLSTNSFFPLISGLECIKVSSKSKINVLCLIGSPKVTDLLSSSAVVDGASKLKKDMSLIMSVSD